MKANQGAYLPFSDHLGSTSLTVNINGFVTSQTGYMPWGGVDLSIGSSPTDYGYTGQMREGDFYYYGARWPKVPEAKRKGFDPSIGRFMQADTIVPLQVQGTQAFDRYAYVNNNPLRYVDPSGHCIGPLAAVCFAIGTWIVSNAGWITAVATTGAIVSYLGHSNADPELVNNEVASQEALDQANLKAIFWISSANMLLEFGEYFSYPRLDSLTTDQAKASTTSNSSNAQTQDYQVPSNLGFKGEPEVITMQPGDQFDRIGHLYGDYGEAPNTPIVQRSLPPSNPGNPLRLFEVTKPIENVLRGTTAPAYGHIGGGIQYKFPMTIQKMLDHGFIKELR